MYGGESCKRHRGWSNNPSAAGLDRGIFKRKEQKKKTLQTVRKYLKKDGTTGYCGLPALKSTQSEAQFAQGLTIKLPLKKSLYSIY